MLDIGWSELLLIGVVALIVIGPRDLPHMFRSLGRITGKLRSMAREFSSAMEDAAHSSGLDEVSKSLNDIGDMTSKRSPGISALDRAADRFEKWDPKLPGSRAAATPDPAVDNKVPGDGITPASIISSESGSQILDSAPGQRRLHAVRRGETKDS